MRAKSLERDVLTTTNNRFGRSQLFQLIAQCERAIQQVRETALLLTSRKKFSRCFMLTGGRHASNLAFDERQLKAADASRLSGTINARDCRLLKSVNDNAAVFNRTSQQLRELNIRHEMKTTCKIVTAFLP